VKSYYSSDTAQSPRDFEFFRFSSIKTLGRTLVQGLEIDDDAVTPDFAVPLSTARPKLVA
jgi:hypothetical protein